MGATATIPHHGCNKKLVDKRDYVEQVGYEGCKVYNYIILGMLKALLSIGISSHH